MQSKTLAYWKDQVNLLNEKIAVYEVIKLS